MFRDLRVAAVVPAFNEERLVAATISTIPKWVDRILLVDDCSEDQTVLQARSVASSRLSIISHTRNRGVGAAIVTGYRSALRWGADAVVVLGADGQMDPAEMARLLEPIADGEADYVKGNRLMHPEIHRRMPLTRRVGNWTLTWLTRRVVGDRDLTDSQCGYTAISNSALKVLPLARLWPRYGYPNDLLAQLRAADLRVVQRPVTPIYGEEESGIRPLTDLPLMGFVLLRSWFRLRLEGSS